MKNEKASKTITIEAGGEKRVDWLVKAVREGEASITMKALTDEESDAMQMSYPVLVHGMLKTESFSGALSSDQKKGVIKLKVPAERRPEQTRLEVRYSPSLATAMVDALPYLVDYPYGCTEQTLNRFIPTVITQKILLNMGIDLKDVKKKRTNLNAQEIGKIRRGPNNGSVEIIILSSMTRKLKKWSSQVSSVLPLCRTLMEVGDGSMVLKNVHGPIQRLSLFMVYS